MKIDLINIIHSLIIWQSLLFAIILITPKYIKKKSNKFLALMLLTLGVHFIYNFLFTNNYFLEVLPPYSCSYGYLYGPLLYLYVKFHLQGDIKFKPIYFLHFTPFVIILLSTLFGFKLCNVIGIWLLPTMLAYCVLGFIEINKYKKVLKQISTNTQEIESLWLKTILGTTILVVMIDILESQIVSVHLWGFVLKLEPVVQLGVLGLVNIIIYQGLKNPSFFQQIKEADIEIVETKNPKDKELKENNKLLEELAQNLENFIELNKPYLDPNLDLTMLAKNLDVHPKTLSQAINQVKGKNFSEFINNYRIEEAKMLLDQNKDIKLTIMEIMYDVGFISRSVFNTAFKKNTGLTPSQYRSQKSS